MMWQCIEIEDSELGNVITSLTSKILQIAGTEFGDGNMDISHMMWCCIWLGDAMLLHHPLQKS
jgi:hypothetical protein